jgi:hypothetical protein
LNEGEKLVQVAPILSTGDEEAESEDLDEADETAEPVSE